MKNSKTARRYTQALLQLARDQHSLDVVSQDFASIQTLINSSVELESFLKNPLIPRAKQISVLEELFQVKVSPLTLTFLKFLAERKKLKLLLQICQETARIYAHMKGILKVCLTSAVSMKKDQVQAICDKLRDYFGKTIEAQTQVDPALLGGFKIVVNDLVYDLSIKNKLNTFRQKVLTA